MLLILLATAFLPGCRPSNSTTSRSTESLAEARPSDLPVGLETIAVEPSPRFSPTIDGEFDEWTDVPPIVEDGFGDGTESFDIDVVKAQVIGQQLFVYFENLHVVNLQNGEENAPTLTLDINLTRSRRLTIDFRGRNATLTSPEQMPRVIPWGELQFGSLPTHASERFELALDLSTLQVSTGDPIVLNFGASDSLERSLLLKADDRTISVAAAPIPQIPLGAARIASINTLHSGLSNPERASSFAAMISLTAPDVICFNEEWELADFQQGADAVLGNSYNLHWSGGCAIASRQTIEPLDFDLRRGAAALVTLDELPVVVVSVHFQCCGFAGSEQDIARIDEARQVVANLHRLRRGEFGEQAAGAGVVILGDFNLVGSREPLDIIESAGQRAYTLRSLTDQSTVTWRGLVETESFWPGRLDYATFDPVRLKAIRGFTLSSGKAARLAPDSSVISNASDHAMLVLDVASANVSPAE